MAGLNRRSRATASTWVILASSFASNLIDSSFAVSKESPRALHNKNGALAFSERTSLGHQETRCQGPRQLSPGQRPEIVRRGPTAVSTMIAGFKEPTQNGHTRIRKQKLRRRRSPRVVLACTDSPEIGYAGGGEPGAAGSKATATVLPAVTPQRPCGVCTEPLGLQAKISS